MEDVHQTVEDLDAWYVEVSGVHLGERAKYYLSSALATIGESFSQYSNGSKESLLDYCTYLSHSQDVLDLSTEEVTESLRDFCAYLEN